MKLACCRMPREDDVHWSGEGPAPRGKHRPVFAGPSLLQRVMERLQQAGFVRLGYADAARKTLLYAHGRRVRDGKRNGWATVEADGVVRYHQTNPAPERYRFP